jgi:hypothetical protein
VPGGRAVMRAAMKSTEIQSIPYGYYWRESVLWIIHMRSRNNN